MNHPPPPRPLGRLPACLSITMNHPPRPRRPRPSPQLDFEMMELVFFYFDSIVALSEIITAAVLLSKSALDKNPHAAMHTWIVMYAAWCSAVCINLYFQSHRLKQSTQHEPNQSHASQHAMDVESQLPAEINSLGSEYNIIFVSRLKRSYHFFMVKRVLDVCSYLLTIAGGMGVVIYSDTNNKTESSLYLDPIIYAWIASWLHILSSYLLREMTYIDACNEACAITSALPTYTAKKERLRSKAEKEWVISGDALCCICRGKYEENDRLRELPCDHLFHDGCIKKWLLERRTCCPLCKREI